MLSMDSHKQIIKSTYFLEHFFIVHKTSENVTYQHQKKDK